MKSLTKSVLSNNDIYAIFAKANLGDVLDFGALTAGEFNAVFWVKTNSQKFVLKVAPSGDTPLLSFEKNMLQHEVAVQRLLEQIKSINIGRVVFSDFTKSIITSDYFIYEFLHGKMVEGARLSKDIKLQIKHQQMAFLAELHSLDVASLCSRENLDNAFGYPRVASNNWHSALKMLVEKLKSDAAAKGRKLKGADRLLYYIDKHKDILEKVSPALVNFDLWNTNIIYNGKNKPIGIIDPERTFIADPIADFVAIDPLKKIEKKQYLIDEYNRHAPLPIQLSPDTKARYYIAVGYLALIMQTEKPYRYKKSQLKYYTHTLAAKLFFNNAIRGLKRL